MEQISPQEKKTFINFLCRNGFVLNFDTRRGFSNFTIDSVNIDLCDKYNLSMGRSLQEFLKEADASTAKKLLKDLLEYYEVHCMANDEKEFLTFYSKCKEISASWTNSVDYFTKPIENLKEKFSNDYLNKQIELMTSTQETNPTEAIGKAKELIESCCKNILEEQGKDIGKHNVGQLVDETLKLLELKPENISDNKIEAITIKGILGNLKAIASNIADLRNSYGSGHGKSASYVGLQARHAKLAVGASVNLVRFLWDTYERQFHR